MRINGHTQVFMILGDPVAQVRAPEVFNALFARHGVNAVLVPAQVGPAQLAAFVAAAFSARNLGGLWLTIPHKAAVLPLLAQCDAQARAATAVNAVRRHANGRLEGALFDGIGFVRALGRMGFVCIDKKVLVVGAGGAGMAIAAALATAGCARVALFDALPGRAARAAAHISAALGFPVDAPDGLQCAGHDLVVNATPMGLHDSDPLPFDPAQLDAHACVVDILMKNLPTPLMRACARRGIDAQPGLEMMLQQMTEYLRFFGMTTLADAVQADDRELRTLLVSAETVAVQTG